MQIEIKNWEKYNPRTDVKHTTWFRVENTFWSDQAIFRLDCEGKMVWFSLLALASQKMNGLIEIEPEFISSVLKITEEKVNHALLELEHFGKIKIATLRPRHVRVTSTSRARAHQISNPCPSNRTDGRTDETDETDVCDGVSAIPPPPPEIIQTPEPPKKARSRKTKADSGPATPAGEVWEAYREAYSARYGHDPIRNAKMNGQCAQLVQRLGAEGAKKVVEFYLTHGSRWYVQNCHALGYCLKDAEGLHTQMLADHRVTGTEAETRDRQQGTMQAFANVAAKLAAERESNGSG